MSFRCCRDDHGRISDHQRSVVTLMSLTHSQCMKSGNFIWNADTGKPPADGIVKKNFIPTAIPDGTQFDAARSMQDELSPAVLAAAFELQFRHWKMMFKEILLSAQRDMNKIAKILRCADVHWNRWHHAAGSLLTHRKSSNLS